MPSLVDQSLNIIRRYQQSSGAYPACPTMPDYQYCWFRDGSFIAHAMLLYGEDVSAFHEWAARTILQYKDAARQAMLAYQHGNPPNKRDVLYARYTYEGGKGPDDWPEFQLDGLGTWLWSLKEFQDRGNPLSEQVCEAANFVAEYLSVLWSSPCHDLWEEHGDQVHTYTLAAIYAGLRAAADLFQRSEYRRTADQIHEFLLGSCTQPDIGFIKSVGVNSVDGSLLALAVPYAVTSLDDPRFVATRKRIETELYVPGAGIHRYLGDSYYGGGTWLLLLAWLGWNYASNGDLASARNILHDIERHALPTGELPEQIVPPMLTSESDYYAWIKMRGPIATPLLWSHAMYLILANACE